MSEHLIFLIIIVGLGIATWIANKVSRGDFLSLFLWSVAGAMPGNALLVKEPLYMLSMLVIFGLIAWRHQWLARKVVA